MINISCKHRESRWVQNAPHRMQIYLWETSRRHIFYHLYKKNHRFTYAFINDIFFIWNGTEEELKSFINRVNRVHPTIKFETNYSYTEINFLDTTVKITSNNELVTTLYKKETDRNTFLHRKSYHPPSTKKSIPYSQALRISRICSDDNDYHKQLEELKDRFIQRGYGKKEIIDQLNKATQHGIPY